MVRVSRARCRWADAAVGEYVERLRRMGGVDEVCVRPETFRGDEAVVRRAEAIRILRAVGSRDELVALDERGRDIDTPGFRALVDDGRQRSDGRLVFAVGGPYGLDASVRDRARAVLRLSAMVLNHEVARVLLFEQIYRALAALHGLPYGHECPGRRESGRASGDGRP